tara:strand:+ start:450 stop:1241 length:792 start_codon:yes stop_codon:yes gene_type:complete
MAETLSYETTPEVTSIDNLNADEQDSLKVGEQMQAAEDSLLAGKYKNAQELEQGYIELQKKLGTEQEESEEPVAESEADETDEAEESDEDVSILDELWEYELNNEEFHEDAVAELQEMDPVELANMHIEYRKQVEEQGVGAKDFTESEMSELKGVVGGDENYQNMLEWAGSNLNQQEIDMFDAVMQRGDALGAFFAIRSLAYRYNDASGYEGKMLTGNAPKTSGSQFRSQQEVVQAMSDSRYESDPAYRKDIMDKLERSNVKF